MMNTEGNRSRSGSKHTFMGAEEPISHSEHKAVFCNQVKGIIRESLKVITKLVEGEKSRRSTSPKMTALEWADSYSKDIAASMASVFLHECTTSFNFELFNSLGVYGTNSSICKYFHGSIFDHAIRKMEPLAAMMVGQNVFNLLRTPVYLMGTKWYQ